MDRLVSSLEGNSFYNKGSTSKAAPTSTTTTSSSSSSLGKGVKGQKVSGKKAALIEQNTLAKQQQQAEADAKRWVNSPMLQSVEAALKVASVGACMEAYGRLEDFCASAGAAKSDVMRSSALAAKMLLVYESLKSCKAAGDRASAAAGGGGAGWGYDAAAAAGGGRGSSTAAAAAFGGGGGGGNVAAAAAAGGGGASESDKTKEHKGCSSVLQLPCYFDLLGKLFITVVAVLELPEASLLMTVQLPKGSAAAAATGKEVPLLYVVAAVLRAVGYGELAGQLDQLPSDKNPTTTTTTSSSSSNSLAVDADFGSVASERGSSKSASSNKKGKKDFSKVGKHNSSSSKSASSVVQQQQQQRQQQLVLKALKLPADALPDISRLLLQQLPHLLPREPSGGRDPRVQFTPDGWQRQLLDVVDTGKDIGIDSRVRV